MKIENLKFDDQGLIPAVVQDGATKDILMVAWMNRESLQKTIETSYTWFFSRSRQSLWMKGETSGNVQVVKEIKYDCDNDTLLVLVEPKGPACHTGEKTCFHRKLGNAPHEVGPSRIEDPEVIEEIKTAIEGPACRQARPVINRLYDVIVSRMQNPPKGSYTAQLFDEGMTKIIAKIEEESEEVVEALQIKDDDEVVWESCDLIYHLLVALAKRGIEFGKVEAELERRRK